jgi:solute carrier family 35 protein F5
MEKTWRWMLGMVYVIAVAVIWIVASFVVQSVVDEGVSPFLITYFCNSLFVVYLPLVEGSKVFWAWVEGRRLRQEQQQQEASSEGKDSGAEKETVHLLEENPGAENPNSRVIENHRVLELVEEPLDAPQEVTNREWSRLEIARVSLLICPFWFLAQFTFNLSLRYTTVTVSRPLLAPPCSGSSFWKFMVTLCSMSF